MDFKQTGCHVRACAASRLPYSFGEMTGLRIKKGVYYEKGFGLLPRMVIWGILGMFINGAFLVFKSGTVSLPLFWYPAHTLTFLLSANVRILFAAFLGVALGVILAIANNKK